jgi:hypothetical protein
VSISGKATAFIGTLPEMFYTHFVSSLPIGPPFVFSDRKFKIYLIFVAVQGGLLSPHMNATKFASSLCVMF